MFFGPFLLSSIHNCIEHFNNSRDREKKEKVAEIFSCKAVMKQYIAVVWEMSLLRPKHVSEKLYQWIFVVVKAVSWVCCKVGEAVWIVDFSASSLLFSHQISVRLEASFCCLEAEEWDSSLIKSNKKCAKKLFLTVNWLIK